MSVLLWGILFGFLAALFQSFSYLFSRRFLGQCRPSARILFCIGHVQMGLLSLAILPFFWTRAPAAWGPLALPLLGTAGFYLMGQFFLFHTLKTFESSQLTPLLGFKIPILAVASFLILGQQIPLLGWVAVLACTAAGLFISPPGKIQNAGILGLALLICTGYAGSDFCIPFLVRALHDVSMAPVVTAVCLCYILSGLVALALLLSGAMAPPRTLLDREVHRFALPYSLSWLAAMACLFACFTLVGVVFGNMVQSTRSLLSVLLAVAVSRLGHHHLENMSTPGVFASRLAGAFLMTGAIALYFWARA